MALTPDGARVAIGHGNYAWQGWSSGAVWVIDRIGGSTANQTLVLPTPVVGTGWFGAALGFSAAHDVMAVVRSRCRRSVDREGLCLPAQRLELGAGVERAGIR